MYVPTYIGVILWIFALFGVLFLILRVLAGVRWKGRRGEGQFSIIVSARNQEDTIEGLIRGFILKGCVYGEEETLLNILLVDAGSSDDTPKVMEKLAQEYCVVKVVSYRELPTYLKGMWTGL